MSVLTDTLELYCDCFSRLMYDVLLLTDILFKTSQAWELIKSFRKVFQVGKLPVCQEKMHTGLLYLRFVAVASQTY